jgi:hypothetical protein
LLPERTPAEPWSRLLSGTWTEHLTATPEMVGALRASELLHAERLPVTATVLARSGSSASIVVLPVGAGRIVISGAMDAWRYREIDAGPSTAPRASPSTALRASGFDDFWRSLIAEASASGEGLQLTFEEPLSAPGSRARFTLRDRRMVPAASTEASAIARCGSAPATVIRVWPAGAHGEFAGELPLSNSGSFTRGSLGEGGCTIEAAIADRRVAGSIAVAATPAYGVQQTLAKLERRVMASGGVIGRAGEEAAIARALTTAPMSPPVTIEVHPMRSAWWLLPFAGCLSVEWWLRRRAGLR